MKTKRESVTSFNMGREKDAAFKVVSVALAEVGIAIPIEVFLYPEEFITIKNDKGRVIITKNTEVWPPES